MSRRIPLLSTERLMVRELSQNDLEVIHRVLDAAFGSTTPLTERQRWLEWTVLGYDMFANLDQPHYGERAIVLRDSGELVGAVGVVPYVDSFDPADVVMGQPEPLAAAEVGLYWAVAPEHQGHGYAAEAARAVIGHLFVHERLGRIIATTEPDNTASQAVMRRLGMRLRHITRARPPEQFVVGVLDNPERVSPRRSD